jgi:hypothetical protein
MARLITGAMNAGICKIEISRYSSAEDNKSPVAPYAKYVFIKIIKDSLNDFLTLKTNLLFQKNALKPLIKNPIVFEISSLNPSP